MACYGDELTSPFPSLGSLSVVMTEAVQRAVGAEDRERALRFELEQTRAQLAATEDRIRAIQEAWEKSEESRQDPRPGLSGLPLCSWRTMPPLRRSQEAFHLPMGRQGEED